MPQIACAHCGKICKKKSADIKDHSHLFCSPKCHYAHQKIREGVRFWRHVTKSDSCWVWNAFKDKDGYGGFKRDSGKFERAHRIAWEFTKGPIPLGLQVLHKCDNPPCVNPDHLWLGTNLDNMRDALRKGRRYVGECNVRATLTDEKVRQIRELGKAGVPKIEIARRMNCARCSVQGILAHRLWTHVV